MVMIGSVLEEDSAAEPSNVPDVVGVALTVMVALAPFARLPRSQVNSAPLPQDPWLAVTLLMIRDESRARVSAAPDAELGPLLVIFATQEIAVPVDAVGGAVSVTARSAGDAEISFTSGD